MAAIVVGDEPYAVSAAAAIMTSGGDAADAATAMYFALSVTYPVAAGLGGGGICLVHDPASSRNEEFDFLARDSTGGGAFAIPGNVRGFAAMHAAYGVLPWQRVISSSESYAAAGFPISRALATRLNAAENVIRLDAGLASEFMDESGHVKSAGSVVTNRELAETLSAIRTQGADALYRGMIGEQLVAYSTAQGGSITTTELAGYPSARRIPQFVRFDDRQIFLPSTQAGAGAFVEALFDKFVQARRPEPEATSVAAALEVATSQTLNGFGVANLPSDFGATGFAATDANGQAVACAVTMNGPFGSGHTARGTGVTLAGGASKSQAGLAAAFLTPVIATDKDGALLLAGAGAGGPLGTASIVGTLARLGKGEFVTRRNGPRLGVVPYDTVNAIVCQANSCTAVIDAGANGLGASPGG
jgi:gamma-glutamyltranspeptidase/glutathione hydrolase